MELSAQYITKTRVALTALEAYINTEHFSSFLDFLENRVNTGSRLVLTGVGKNSHIARKISETMASLGIKSFFLDACHAPHGDFGYLQPNDTIIYITRSGTTKEISEAIWYVNNEFVNNKIIQILIHCNMKLTKNPLVDFEVCLNDVVEADSNELAPTISTTIILAFLDMISIELSKKAGFSKHDFYRYHPGGALGAQLKAELK